MVEIQRDQLKSPAVGFESFTYSLLLSSSDEDEVSFDFAKFFNIYLVFISHFEVLFNKKFQEEDITDVEDEEENVDEDVKTESEEEFEGGEIEGLFL